MTDFTGKPDDPSTFHLAIAGSPTLQARWDAVSASVIAHAATLGMRLTKNDVECLPSARLSVLAGTPLEGESYVREINGLPALAEKRKSDAQAEALARGDKEALDKLAAMSRPERISYARAHGLDKMSEGPKTADEQARELEMVLTLNPSARISAARKLGLN